MTAESGDASSPLRGLKEASAKGPPPVHLWNPPFCGDIDMRIAGDGTWYYMNSPIGRKPLMKLFASVMRHDEDGKFYLVTPVEKCGIRVDDAPFVAIRMAAESEGRAQIIRFETNTDDEVTVDTDHPLRFETETGTDGLKPYVLVRARLEALVSRALFYDLVALGKVEDGWFGVWSSGRFWRMQRAGEIGASGVMEGYRFDLEEFRALAASRLLKEPSPPSRGDDDLNPEARAIPYDVSPRPAAVLVPIVMRDPEVSVLLTLRTEQLRSHSGQVAFPGGKIDAGDGGPVETALRETEEETGVARSFIEPIGFLEGYLTRTSFSVVPVVGLVRLGFEVRPEPGEVAAVFEVPLRFLMTPANHQRHSRQWQGKTRHFHAMPWQDRFIWGATAGMIMNLYDRLYAQP